MKKFAVAALLGLLVAVPSYAQQAFAYKNAVGPNSSFQATNLGGLVKSPAYRSGNFYPAFPMENSNSAGSAGYVSGTIYFSPMFVNNRVTVTSLTTRITASSTSASMVVGVYVADPATASPTTLLTTSNIQNITSAGYVTFTLSPSVTLEPNATYYVGSLADGGATMPSIWVHSIAQCVSAFRNRVGGITVNQVMSTGGCGYSGTGAVLAAGLSSTIPVSTLSIAGATFGTPAFVFQAP